MRTNSHPDPVDHLDNLLEANLRTVQGLLIKAGGEDSVGFVIDGEDEDNRKILAFLWSRWKGITQQEAEAEIDASIESELCPVFIFADDGLYATALLLTLAKMAPYAQEQFDRLRYDRSDNEYLVVVIAAGGFKCYQVPSLAASDGQNRTAIR